MRIPKSRSLLLLWFINIMFSIAAPFQNVPTENVPRVQQTSLDASSPTQILRTHHKAFLDHQVQTQKVRRGGGGSAAAPVALGSFQLDTKMFRTFSTIVPAILAASYMTDFLDIVALRIETGEWGHEPPAQKRVIHMWNFELSFHSLHTPIPWDFIQAYVIELADDIAKGFVGTFDEYMLGVINGVATAVTVKLKMMSEPMVLT